MDTTSTGWGHQSTLTPEVVLGQVKNPRHRCSWHKRRFHHLTLLLNTKPLTATTPSRSRLFQFHRFILTARQPAVEVESPDAYAGMNALVKFAGSLVNMDKLPRESVELDRDFRLHRTQPSTPPYSRRARHEIGAPVRQDRITDALYRERVPKMLRKQPKA